MGVVPSLSGSALTIMNMHCNTLAICVAALQVNLSSRSFLACACVPGSPSRPWATVAMGHVGLLPPPMHRGLQSWSCHFTEARQTKPDKQHKPYETHPLRRSAALMECCSYSSVFWLADSLGELLSAPASDDDCLDCLLPWRAGLGRGAGPGGDVWHSWASGAQLG
jgi:hypothetical protein